jgi:hypothetical protein
MLRQTTWPLSGGYRFDSESERAIGIRGRARVSSVAEAPPGRAALLLVPPGCERLANRPSDD